jgi:photosystem II stability/assembly factor-like uncharacterized protein
VRIALIAAITLPAALAAQVVTKTTVTTAELRGLSLVSDRVAWASGQRGTVARTVDGGDSWQVDTVAGATNLDFRSIHAFDDLTAIVASAGEAEKGLAHIYRTRDGGRSWTKVFSTDEKGVFFDALAFFNGNTGFALSDPVGGRFAIVSTRDGGSTWARDSTRGPATIAGEAAFAASGGSMVAMDPVLWIGTGGGGRARVMRSENGGRSWTTADVPMYADGASGGIFAIAFSDFQYGIAVGGDYTRPRHFAKTVAITQDGGRTWRTPTNQPAVYLSSVTFSGSFDRVIATGLAGTFISRDRGESWAQVDSIPMNTVRSNGRTTFLVGPRGRVERWKR